MISDIILWLLIAVYVGAWGVVFWQSGIIQDTFR